MRPLPNTESFKTLARKIIWFEPPEVALQSPIRFVTYAMTYGGHAEMKIIRQYYSDQELQEVLEKMPPGIIDNRSWAYWNLILGRYPTPALPTRWIPQ